MIPSLCPIRPLRTFFSESNSDTESETEGTSFENLETRGIEPEYGVTCESDVTLVEATPQLSPYQENIPATESDSPASVLGDIVCDTPSYNLATPSQPLPIKASDLHATSPTQNFPLYTEPAMGGGLAPTFANDIPLCIIAIKIRQSTAAAARVSLSADDVAAEEISTEDKEVVIVPTNETVTLGDEFVGQQLEVQLLFADHGVYGTVIRGEAGGMKAVIEVPGHFQLRRTAAGSVWRDDGDVVADFKRIGESTRGSM